MAAVLRGGGPAGAALPGGGLDGVEDFAELAAEGFLRGVDGPHPEGSTRNTYAWSGAWFRGKFYVGTGRNLNCLRTSRGLPGCPANGLPAPEDRAEIWAYTPGGEGGLKGTWERVHQSPLASIPFAGAIPRDVGYRGMAVCAAGGPPRLWVAALGLGARILGSRDGRTFAEASTLGIHNSLAEIYAGTSDLGFRALLCWKGRLLAAPTGAVGEGDVAANPVVLANADPADPASPWETVAHVVSDPALGDPNNLGVFSMTSLGDAVYLGVTNLTTGVEIWKGTGCDAPPAPCVFEWTKIVDDGGGRPRTPLTKVDNGGATDMAAFRGAVYAGVSTSSFFNSTTAEVLRVNADGTYDLVMGEPRRRASMPGNFNCRTAAELPESCVPLSGMGSGWGGGPPDYAPGAAGYVWRLTSFDSYLYAGALSTRSGLMRSRDGETWTPVAAGLSTAEFFAVRTLVAVPRWPGGPALVIGTVGANEPGGGLQVHAGSCAAHRPPVAVARTDGVAAGSSFPGVELAHADASGAAEVTLDASGSLAPFCGRIAAYEWYEGNLVGRSLEGLAPFARGVTASLRLEAGADFSDYEFTLRVVDEQGREGRRAVTVRATRNAPPTAVIEAPASSGAGSLALVDLDGDGVEHLRLRGACGDPEGALVSCTWSSSGNVSIANPAGLDTVAVVGLGGFRSETVSLVAVDDHGYRTVARLSLRLRRPGHDVAVEAIEAGVAAKLGVPQLVTVTLRNDGAFPETATLSLADRGGGTVGPATRTVSLAPGGVGEATFSWAPAATGLQTLTAAVEPVEGERIVIDNERSLLVSVAPP